MAAPVTIRIQDADFDIAAEIDALSHGRSEIGAVVSFTGLCRGRDDGRDVAALTLEHYPGMAEAEIRRHVELGVRGDPEQVGPAMEMLAAGVTQLGFEWEPLAAENKRGA